MIARSGARMPPAPWAPECHGQRGVIRGYNDDRFFTTYEIGIDILQMFDAQTKRGDLLDARLRMDTLLGEQFSHASHPALALPE